MPYVQSVGFGSGFMFMTPAAGGTPVRVGILQEGSFDVSFDEKPLYGQNQWPVALARGKAKGAIKSKFAQIDKDAIGKIFFGGSPAVGQDQTKDLEAATVPVTPGPYVVTVASAVNYVADLGVFYALTGQPLEQVAAGSEAAGKYSVVTSGANKGKYTFAAADQGAAVLISYQINDATVGYKTTLSNQPMGTVSYFQLDTFQNNPESAGSQWGMRFYRCASSKLTLPFKQDDWTITEFDASVQANAAGKVMDFNSPS